MRSNHTNVCANCCGERASLVGQKNFLLRCRISPLNMSWYHSRSCHSERYICLSMLLVQFTKSILDLPLWGAKEYSLEKMEWVILLVFAIWAISYACLLMNLTIRIKNWKGKISLILLLVSSSGLIIAGILNVNPVPPQKTETRPIHKPLKPASNERYLKHR